MEPNQQTPSGQAPAHPPATPPGKPSQELRTMADPTGAREGFLNKLTAQVGMTREAIEVVKRTVASGTSDTELAFFLMACKSKGLDPINKEMWCIKDKDGRLLIFAGRDGFLKLAMADPRYNGMRSAAVRKNDEFEMDVPNGKVHHIIRGNNEERGPLIGAWCKVFLIDRRSGKDIEPTLVWAPWATFNRNFGAWKTHGDELIVKCAESHGLKKGCAISGLTVEEDFYVDRGVAYAHNVQPTDAPNTAQELNDLAALSKRFREKLALVKDPEVHERFRLDGQRRRMNGTFDQAYADEKMGEMDAVIAGQKPAEPAALPEERTEDVAATVVDTTKPTADAAGEGAAQ